MAPVNFVSGAILGVKNKRAWIITYLMPKDMLWFVCLPVGKTFKLKHGGNNLCQYKRIFGVSSRRKEVVSSVSFVVGMGLPLSGIHLEAFLLVPLLAKIRLKLLRWCCCGRLEELKSFANRRGDHLPGAEIKNKTLLLKKHPQGVAKE